MSPEDCLPQRSPADLVLAPTDHREARLGEIIHNEAVRRLQELYPFQEFEQPVKVKGLDSEGKYDRYNEPVGEVEDIKTVGNYIWDLVHEFGALIDHWKQVALYGLALEDADRPVSWLKLTYLKRENGHDMTFSRPYDREFAEAARQELLAIATALDLWYAEILELRETTGNPEAWADPGEALPRTRSGPSTDPICQRCEFRRHCWKLDEAEAAGRSGESWVELGPAPQADDPVTVWAVENARAAMDLANQTEKAKKEAQALVDGLEPGRYGTTGEYTVSLRNYGGKPRYQDYAQRLIDTAVVGGDLLQVDVPRGPESWKTEVKRTSKSVLEREAKERGEVITLPKAEGGVA